MEAEKGPPMYQITWLKTRRDKIKWGSVSTLIVVPIELLLYRVTTLVTL
jgi:hypothetical protein